MKDKINDIESLYSSIDKLVSLLKIEGHEEASSKLQFYVHEIAWTTGSELIGELNLYLNKLNVPIEKETLSLLNECKNFCKNHRRIMGI